MPEASAPPRPSRPRKPTLRTLAERTGFAVTTVSRALANDPQISQKTRAAVSEAAHAVGYAPDRAAQRLRTGRTKVISLLINPDHEYLGFTSQLLSGVTEALRGTSYAITITPDFIQGDRLGAIQTILRQNLADGVIISRTECFDPRVRALLEADFPFVSHGRTEFTIPHPWVDFDNERFARAAVERLAALGRRRLCIVPPESRFTFAQHLRYGFLSAARGAGLDWEIPESVTLDSPPDDIADWMRRRWRAPDPPDGYVCVGEVAALAVLAAAADNGLVLGRDFDVAAKQASPIFGLLRPRVETVLEDVRASGEALGRLLLRRIEGEAPEGLNWLAPPVGSFERGRDEASSLAPP